VLRANGFKVVAPAMGPLSSNWERCCELFAQLTGQRVDYGISRAERFKHSRFGKDYTGKALVPEFFFGNTKIKAISHSMVRF
jgi:triacylglycerol lipase